MIYNEKKGLVKNILIQQKFIFSSTNGQKKFRPKLLATNT